MGGALIDKRRVGTTSLEISRIGFGGAPVGDIRRARTAADAEVLLDAAWNAGIRYFDTAPFYGAGLSERRIGDYLRGKPRDQFVLSTKVGRLLLPDRAEAERRYGPGALPFRPVFDFSYDGVMRSHEFSLQRLGFDRIDILYLHDIGRFSQRDNHETNLRIALEGGVKALDQLRAEGTVRAIGVGVNETEVLETLMEHASWDVFLLANRYTLLDQRPLASFLPRMLEEQVSIVIGAPLNSGILATGPVPGATFDYAPASDEMLERTRRILALCDSYGVPLIKAALNFPLGHPAVTSLLPGPSNQGELVADIGYLKTPIPEALWADLRRQGLIEAAAPAPVVPVIAS